MRSALKYRYEISYFAGVVRTSKYELRILHEFSRLSIQALRQETRFSTVFDSLWRCFG